MGESRIPVDIRNPGQVLACLGLMEIADLILGSAQGRFNEQDSLFTLQAGGNSDPVHAAMDFILTAKLTALPNAAKDDKNTRPIELRHEDHCLRLSHWDDASRPEDFKLYSGDRAPIKIAEDMRRLMRELDRSTLFRDPWNALCPMGGSFNFDPRGAWNPLDVGYSPNDHVKANQGNVFASPAVELFAAAGLEHARPTRDRRQVRYAIWTIMLPIALARAALGGCVPTIPQQHCQFRLGESGKNKIVTFAHKEMSA